MMRDGRGPFGECSHHIEARHDRQTKEKI